MRGKAEPRVVETDTASDDALMVALDPSLGIFAGVDSLVAPGAGLPVGVRGRLVGTVFAWPREVYGRGGGAGDALVSVVSAALEQLGLDSLDGKGDVPGIRMGVGTRTTIDAATVVDLAGVGCAAELSSASEHAALEAWERRAVARAWASGDLDVRLDDRAEPAAIGRILDWHRGRGCRVASVLLERGPPVVACIASPVDPAAPALVGVAAARTGGTAWRAAAMELHQAYLARCLGARSLDVRGKRGEDLVGRVLGASRDHAIDRTALDAALAATRRSIDPSSIVAFARAIEAVAVEVTTPVAARLGRRVVAAVLPEA